MGSRQGAEGQHTLISRSGQHRAHRKSRKDRQGRAQPLPGAELPGGAAPLLGYVPDYSCPPAPHPQGPQHPRVAQPLCCGAARLQGPALQSSLQLLGRELMEFEGRVCILQWVPRHPAWRSLTQGLPQARGPEGKSEETNREDRRVGPFFPLTPPPWLFLPQEQQEAARPVELEQRPLTWKALFSHSTEQEVIRPMRCRLPDIRLVSFSQQPNTS